jgi:hypothetical protein
MLQYLLILMCDDRTVLEVTHDVTVLTDDIKVTCDDTVTHDVKKS